MKRLRKFKSFPPLSPPILTADTVIKSSMTTTTIMTIGDMAMEDFDRHHESMTLKELGKVMDIIAKVSKLNEARYIELVAQGRSIGFDYDPLNLVQKK